MSIEASIVTEPLPLNALFREFLINFPQNVRNGDTLKSNAWARQLKEQTEKIFQPLRDRFGLSIKPMGGVGVIRTNGQYISFPKSPMSTSRGFYPYISFRFDEKEIELGIGGSFQNEIPETFKEVIHNHTNKALPDFTSTSKQGLKTKVFSLDEFSDARLTNDLVKMAETYVQCIAELGDEVAEFCESTGKASRKTLTEEQLEQVIDAYLEWCSRNKDDEHLLAEYSPEYSKWSKDHFTSLPIQEFISMIDTFVRQGGKIQSGGSRGGDRFLVGLQGREEQFRSHLLSVFAQDFDLHSWWLACDQYPRFGKGIRSIYLHRALPNTFTVFNEKALEGYKLFGLIDGRLNSSAESYEAINTAAKALVARRPGELTLFLADHMTHFITIDEGIEILRKIQGVDAATIKTKAYIWTIGAGGQGKIVERCIEDGIVAIDFDIRVPLYNARTEKELEAMLKASGVVLSDSSRSLSTVERFVNEVSAGDIVLLRNGLSLIEAVGVISSAYYYDPKAEEYPHYRTVEWVAKGPWNLFLHGVQLAQTTVVSNDPQSDRFIKIKEFLSWDSFAPKLSETQANVNLSEPFRSIFRDRLEASWAFDLIQDALAVLNFSSTERAELTAITIQSKSPRLSLSLGGRWLLSFTQENGQLEITWCVSSSKESARNKVPKREFTTRGVSSGYVQLSQAWSDISNDKVMRQDFLDSIRVMKGDYHQKCPNLRYNIQSLYEAAYDLKKRDEYFKHGIKFIEELPDMSGAEFSSSDGESQVKRGRNIIYFGPPGTGKTWKILHDELPRFESVVEQKSENERLQDLVTDQSWWVVIGAALQQLGPSKVMAIMNHQLVQARHALSTVKNLRATIWASLQTHTPLESSTVAYSNRQEPFIFQKSEDSTWSIIPNCLTEQAPEVLELLEKSQLTESSSSKTVRHAFVTFHQSFSYEDFIEGIKPTLDNETDERLPYEIQPGIFKRLCDRARKDPSHEYAILIDEINRGNIANIFGELISLIEEDKRESAPGELSLCLPYSKEMFSVPANVSIIGTMNSADRSVEALDTALRRRFTFIEMPPSVECLRENQISVDGIDIPRLFEVINIRLEKLLSKDHQIGHSYFLDLAAPKNTLASLKQLFSNKIIPLLQEYFYGDLGRIGLVLGGAFVEPVSEVDFAPFDYPDAELLLERPVYRLKSLDSLTPQDFITVYT